MTLYQIEYPKIEIIPNSPDAIFEYYRKWIMEKYSPHMFALTRTKYKNIILNKVLIEKYLLLEYKNPLEERIHGGTLFSLEYYPHLFQNPDYSDWNEIGTDLTLYITGWDEKIFDYYTPFKINSKEEMESILKRVIKNDNSINMNVLNEREFLIKESQDHLDTLRQPESDLNEELECYFGKYVEKFRTAYSPRMFVYISKIDNKFECNAIYYFDNLEKFEFTFFYVEEINDKLQLYIGDIDKKFIVNNKNEMYKILDSIFEKDIETIDEFTNDRKKLYEDMKKLLNYK